MSDEGVVLAISFHAEIDRADEPRKTILWRPKNERAAGTGAGLMSRLGTKGQS